MSSTPHLIKITLSLMMRSRQQRVLFAGVIGTIAATAVFSAVLPVFFALGIDALTAGSNESQKALAYVVSYGIGFTLVAVMEQVQWLTFGPLNLRLQRRLTTYAFSHAVSLPYYRLKSYTTYEIGRIVEKGLDAVRDITSNLTFFLIPTAIELVIAATVIAFVIDIWIAALLAVALGLYFVLANLSAERIRLSTETAMQASIESWNYGLDGVANAELVQQSSLGDAFVRRLDDKLKINDKAWIKTFQQRAYYGVLQAIVFGVVVLGVLWRGSISTSEGTLSIGELVLLNTYIIRLLQPVETFARVYRDVHASLGEARLLAELLTVEAESAKTDAATWERPPTLYLEDLAVDAGGTTVLSGLTCSVQPGQPLYVVGPSGVGKSSLLKVLSCLTLPSAGHYSINGVQVTSDNAASMRSKISVVQQDCLLFDWTVRENLTFGYMGDDEDVEQVLDLLGLREVVMRHEALGEQTVGERGSRLSGGEKQRISLARALLRRPSVLLLDEPTSALDESNRRRVLAAISSLQKSCTSVIVTHDTSLLETRSNVLYLRDKSTAIRGLHGDLLAESSSYREFIEGGA